MSRIRNLLQVLSLYLNRWELGERCNRLCYDLAVMAAVRLFAKNPIVVAAYARNTYAKGNWIPGLSDIDLTVILRSDEPAEAELRRVRKFQNAYESLRHLFPMLGEIEFLNEAHITAKTRYAITGYEARHWLRLYGDDIVQSEYEGGERQQRCDSLSYAVGFYRHKMVSALASEPRHIIVRCLKKILWYLDVTIDEDMEYALANASPLSLHVLVLKHLDHRAQAEWQLPLEGDLLDIKRVLGGPAQSEVTRGLLPDALLKETLALKSIATILVSSNNPSHFYFIVRDDLDIKSLKRGITAARGCGGMPIVMTRALIGHYLQFVDPLEHLAMLRERIVLWGDDMLPLTRPWTKPVFYRAVCTYATEILAFPYKMDVEEMSARDFHDLLLGWVLRTANFFQNGVMEFNYYSLVKSWHIKHPTDGVSIPSTASPLSIVQRFELLRNLSDKISQGMTDRVK